MMNLRTMMAVVVLCLTSSRLVAQDLQAFSFPPIIQGEAFAVTIDKAGNQFIAGRFMGTLDFNPGVGDDTKTSGGGFDVFVTRINADNTYAWTKTFGGSLIDIPKSVVIIGNTLYVGGTFASTNAGVGGGGSLAASGLRDVFVWAMDATTGLSIPTFGNGGIQTFGGTGTDNLQAMVAYGKNLIVAGNFDSTNAGVGGPGTIAAAHALDCYVIMMNGITGALETKFGTDGGVAFGGSDVDEVAHIAVSGSTLYVTGNFKSLDFGYEGTTLFAPLGVRSAFILSINLKNGSINKKFGTIGAVRFGGGATTYGWRLAVSGSSIFMGGTLLSNNAGLNALGTFSTNGMDDAYVISLTKAGTLNTKFGTGGFIHFGGGANETFGGMAVSKSLYFTGVTESDNAPLGPGAVAGHVDKKDIFIVAVNPRDGTMNSKTSFGFSFFGGSEDELCNDLAVGKKAVFVAGSFNSQNAGYRGTAGYRTNNQFGGLILPFDILTGVFPVPKP